MPELEAVRKEVLWALRDLGDSRAESELVSGFGGLGKTKARSCTKPYGLKYEDDDGWKVDGRRYKTKAAANAEAYRAEYSTGHAVKTYRACTGK